MLEEYTQEMMEELFDHILILRKPVFSFTECFTTYTKEDMIAIAQDTGLKVRSSKPKRVIAEDFFEQLSLKSHYKLTFQPTENIQLLKELMSGPKEIDFLSFSRKHPDLFDLLYFRWVFLFYYEDTYTLVLPKETKGMLLTFINDTEFKETHHFRYLIHNYVDAFLNLYGAFESDFIVETWNKHNKQHPLEKTDLLFEIVKLGWFEERIRITDNLEFIFDASVLDEADVPSFIRDHSIHKYYQPTKADIQYFAKHEFDERTAQYEKMKRFFSKKCHAEKLIDVTDMIMAHIKLDLGLQSLGQSLENQFGIIFGNRKDIEDFAKLYKELNNHTRKWSTRGHTPHEIPSKNRNQKSASKAGSQLMGPISNQPIRAEKIGRNDPCPCGSGKKYKQCHGR